jgi:cellulose synthase (UDP-forming)
MVNAVNTKRVGTFLGRLGSIGRQSVYGGLALVCAAAFIFLASLPTDLYTQTILVLSIYAGLILANRWRGRRYGRLIFLSFLVLLSLRYFVWRTFNTLGFEDPWSFALMVTLYLAEIFGFLLFLLSVVVNILPLNREKQEVKPDESRMPTVDVFIPTYNEAPELVAITVAAATQIKYPEDKIRVYVLDDGGTKAKIENPDPVLRAEALERQRLLKNLCKQFGASYLARDANDHAKAGNFNEAMKVTEGDLILTLDADHVPTTDILMNTVGLFQRDEKLFLVQTPHFMINADPIERNLDTFRRMPSENEMFYRSVQKGLDFWDATLFCGSAAILLRQALEENGGLSLDSITEDAETALTLHARGWKSAYLAKPMVAGLAPETFSSLILQRTRWAQGMVQILLLKNPLLMPGLSLSQRIGYLSSCLYWLFPIARFIFLIAPLGFLFFGLHIYNVSGAEFLIYTIPHFIGSMIFSTVMFGNVRWPLIGAVYELMQSLFALPAVISTFIHPRKPAFKVTPKGEQLDEEFVSPLSTPFYVVFGLICLAFVAAYIRWHYYPGQRDVILVTGLWNLLNFLALLMALGTLLERRQMRLNPRIPAEIEATLVLGGMNIPGRLVDLSIGGARFTASNTVPDHETLAVQGHLLVASREDDAEPVSMGIFRIAGAPNMLRTQGIGLKFDATDAAAFLKIVDLVHGDSGRWESYWHRNDGNLAVLEAVRFLLWSGLINSAHHFHVLLRALWHRLAGLGLSENQGDGVGSQSQSGISTE